MELFVIRHAAAVPRGGEIPDRERPLTREGRSRFERAVRGLDALGVRFDRAYHSPWTRAAQTAELLSELVDGKRVAMQELADRPTPALLRQLRGKRPALVGHQPWLGELVAMLVLGDPRKGERLELKKGAVVWLEGRPRPGGMTLRAILPPKVLRALRP